MKRNVLGLAGVLVLAIVAPVGAVNAADMAIKAPPTAMAPVPPYFNWTGFYVGANVGGMWADDSFSGTTTTGATVAAFSGSNTYSGIVGGGQIGANYQFPNNWVIGIEADIDGSGLSGTTSVCGVAAAVTTACASDKTKINDFGTVRGRLGYAASNVLFYGTGGWAWSNSSTTSTLTCVGAGCPTTSGAFTGGSSSASTTANGWAAGAGIEWAFNRNWTMRVEYLHLQFNGIGQTLSSTGTAAGVPFVSTSTSSANANNDLVRVGLNYIFH